MADGAWAGFLFLFFLALSFIAALTGTIDDIVVWVFGAELLKMIGLCLLGLVLIVFLVRRRFSDNDAYGHVTFVQGGDRAREQLQKHEEAHQKVCARVGGGGSTIRIWPDKGGWSGQTTFHDPHRVAALEPEKKIAIALAGIIAAPDTTSPNDKPHAKAYARKADNPSQAMREGKRIARRIV